MQKRKKTYFFRPLDSKHTEFRQEMFEAKILEGAILKKIVEAIKDVVNDVNIDVSPSGKFKI